MNDGVNHSDGRAGGRGIGNVVEREHGSWNSWVAILVQLSLVITVMGEKGFPAWKKHFVWMDSDTRTKRIRRQPL